MIRLEVHPELSTGNVRVQGGFTLPDKDVTQVTTNVMCRSGATVILGGLIREDLAASSTQIPVLGNLPLLGVCFASGPRTRNAARSSCCSRRASWANLACTPKPNMRRSMRDRRNAFFDKMQPINKRRIGDRYYRLAISAWAATDGDMALRYANLAIHYDPLHQSAIDLRQEILAVHPNLEQTTQEHLRYGLRPWEHPYHDYSAQTGWPWREVGPVGEPPAYPTPVNTGSSGHTRTIVTDQHVPQQYVPQQYVPQQYVPQHQARPPEALPPPRATR